MKNVFLGFCLSLVILCCGCHRNPQLQAAYDLIERVTPGYSNQFKLELIPPAADSSDVYEISSDGNKIILRGNNPVSLAKAYNQYIKNK